MIEFLAQMPSDTMISSDLKPDGADSRHRSVAGSPPATSYLSLIRYSAASTPLRLHACCSTLPLSV
jgi:hypothetical protein